MHSRTRRSARSCLVRVRVRVRARVRVRVRIRVRVRVRGRVRLHHEPADAEADQAADEDSLRLRAPHAAAIGDDHPPTSRPDGEVEDPRDTQAEPLHPRSAHRPVPETEGDPADDGGEDEARRSEHARDDHGENLGAPCQKCSHDRHERYYASSIGIERWHFGASISICITVGGIGISIMRA